MAENKNVVSEKKINYSSTMYLRADFPTAFLLLIENSLEQNTGEFSLMSWYLPRKMTIFDTKVSNILNIQFIPVGINAACSKVRENFIVVIMNFLFVVVAYSLLRNYMYLNSYLYKMDVTVYLVATIFVFNTFWISRYQKQLLQNILGAIVEDEKDAEFAQLIQYYLKPLFLKVTSWHISALCLVIILPIFAVCFTNSALGSPPTLLFPSWFPWQTRTVSQYILTVLLQLVSGSVLYSLALTQEIVVVCYAAVLEAHLTRFCRSVREWDDDPYLNPRAWNPKESEGKTIIVTHENIKTSTFRDILAHFSYIQLFLKDVVTCCSPFSANSLFIFFDASVFLTAMLVQKENYLLYRMKMIAGELLGCTIFGVFCHLGDIINRTNDVFRDTIYDTRWYQKSPKSRKQILIFMQLTQKSIRIRAFQMYAIDRVFFGKIVRLCFSILQLLLKLHNK